MTCYVRGFVDGEILRIQEFCFHPGKEASLRNFIATMAQILKKNNVHISYPSNEEVAIFAPWSLEKSKNTILMASLLQFDKLAVFGELLQPPFPLLGGRPFLMYRARSRIHYFYSASRIISNTSAGEDADFNA